MVISSLIVQHWATEYATGNMVCPLCVGPELLFKLLFCFDEGYRVTRVLASSKELVNGWHRYVILEVKQLEGCKAQLGLISSHVSLVQVTGAAVVRPWHLSMSDELSKVCQMPAALISPDQYSPQLPD